MTAAVRVRRARPLDALEPLIPQGRLDPNASIVENGFTSQTDEFGRLKTIEGDLSLTPGVRDGNAQRTVGWEDRLSTDQGGHGVATRFNGPSGNNNLNAQETSTTAPTNGSRTSSQAAWRPATTST
jgi:hypothetical protein